MTRTLNPAFAIPCSRGLHVQVSHDILYFALSKKKLLNKAYTKSVFFFHQFFPVPICKIDPHVSAIQYTTTISGYSIAGPVLRSLTTINEMACECTCQLTAEGLCYMFNYHPLSKMCVLFYKDRTDEYTVAPQAGMTFKTRKVINMRFL